MVQKHVKMVFIGAQALHARTHTSTNIKFWDVYTIGPSGNEHMWGDGSYLGEISKFT